MRLSQAAAPVRITVSGARGPSNYELWLAAGNTGTLDDFLDAQSASAAAEADRAELAAAGAVAAHPIYPDVATGLAATTEGGYFTVEGSGDDFADLYRKVSGAAVAKGSYPSAAAVAARPTGAQLAAADGADLIGYRRGPAYITRTVQQMLGDLDVSAHEFGATGDGTTDDSAAIQAAMDAVGADGGGVVKLRPGLTYAIGTELVGVRKVVLEGGRADRSFNSTVLKARVGGMPVLFTGDEDGAGMRHMFLAGSALTGTGYARRGINYAGDGAVWSNLAFEFFADEAMWLNGLINLMDLIGIGNSLMEPDRDGEDSGVLRLSGADHVGFRIEVSPGLNGRGGKTAGGNCGAILIDGNNMQLSHLLPEYGDFGVKLSGTVGNHQIWGSRADRCYGHGWIVDSPFNTLGVGVIDCGLDQTNTYDGIVLTEGGNDVAFKGRCGSADPSKLGRYAVNDQFGSSQPELRNNTTVGRCVGFASGLASTVNLIGGAVDDRGVTAPAVANATSQNVDGIRVLGCYTYTAATELANFWGGYDGKELLVYGDSHVTIVTTGNIDTDTGSAVTLTSGVLYLFVRYGGRWKMLARS